MLNLLLILIISVNFVSCEDNRPKNQEDCEVLSMKSFRGLPKEAKLFKDHCQNYELTYTKQRCEQALQELMISTNLGKVQKSHGQLIKECFNQSDLKRFAKDLKE